MVVRKFPIGIKKEIIDIYIGRIYSNDILGVYLIKGYKICGKYFGVKL